MNSEIRNELNSQYPCRVEIHAHTSPASHCADLAPAEVVEIFYRAGYDGIAITNHFYTQKKDKNKFIEMYTNDFRVACETGEKLGIKVYFGAELRFKKENDNDYLIFGIKPEQLGEIYDYLNKDLETFVREYKTDDMFLIQAHPFRDDMELMNPELLDGIEAFNLHPHHNGRITLASRYAQTNGKVETIGSDFHHKTHDNLCATRFKALPENEAELVKAFKENDFIYEIAGHLMV